MSNKSELESEKIIIEDHISFSGSAKRIWRFTKTDNEALKWVALVPAALILIGMAWCVVVIWYALFGIFLLPIRFINRSKRREKRERLRHREAMEAISTRQQ